MTPEGYITWKVRDRKDIDSVAERIAKFDIVGEVKTIGKRVSGRRYHGIAKVSSSDIKDLAVTLTRIQRLEGINHLSVNMEIVDKTIDAKYTELNVKCPYGSEIKVPSVPKRALRGRKDFVNDVICSSLPEPCTNYNECHRIRKPYFVIEIKDGKIKTQKRNPEF